MVKDTNTICYGAVMIVSPPLNDELSIYGILGGCVIDTRFSR